MFFPVLIPLGIYLAVNLPFPGPTNKNFHKHSRVETFKILNSVWNLFFGLFFSKKHPALIKFSDFFKGFKRLFLKKAKFSIGDIVKHKHFEFRGVIYDVDFEFNNSEEWYQSIPKNVRPRKDQPFYHLLAENDEITYEAYVSEQNLLIDDSDEPIKHPLIEEIFSGKKGSGYFKQSN